jgi:hypothetical protein
MGVTSSGLLDEERVAGAESTSEPTPQTFTQSGEINAPSTEYIGRPVAGSKWVCWEGPCTYVLEQSE